MLILVLGDNAIWRLYDISGRLSYLCLLHKNHVMYVFLITTKLHNSICYVFTFLYYLLLAHRVQDVKINLSIHSSTR